MDADMRADFAKHGYHPEDIDGDFRFWTPGPLPGTAIFHNTNLAGPGMSWMSLIVNERDLPQHVREWFDWLRPTNGTDPVTGKHYAMPKSWLLEDGSREYCLGQAVQWEPAA